MKKSFIIIYILFSITNLLGQDLIIKKNGEEIVSKVIEVTDRVVKFKKASNLDGPTYTLNKQEIVFVKYENGEKDVFTNTSIVVQEKPRKLKFKSGSGRYYLGDERISKDELKKLLQKDNESYQLWKKGRRHLTYSKIMLLSGAIGLGAYFGSEIGKSNAEKETGVKSNETSPALLIAGTGLTTGGILYLISSSKKRKQAVRTYNKSTKISYGLKINNNGIGIALSF